jgi:hypothetical protein
LLPYLSIMHDFNFIRRGDVSMRDPMLLSSGYDSMIDILNSEKFIRDYASEAAHTHQSMKDKVIERLLTLVQCNNLRQCHLDFNLDNHFRIRFCSDLIRALDIATDEQRLKIINCFINLLTNAEHPSCLQITAYQAIKKIAEQLTCTEQVVLIRELTAHNHNERFADLLPFVMQANIILRAISENNNLVEPVVRRVMGYCG